MFAAWTDLGAARYRIPCHFSPFDVCLGCHNILALSELNVNQLAFVESPWSAFRICAFNFFNQVLTKFQVSEHALWIGEWSLIQSSNHNRVHVVTCMDICR